MFIKRFCMLVASVFFIILLHNLHIPIIALIVTALVMLGLVLFGTTDAVHYYTSEVKRGRDPAPYEYSGVFAIAASLFLCFGVLLETLKSQANLSEGYVWVYTLLSFVILSIGLKKVIEARARMVVPYISFT